MTATPPPATGRRRDREKSGRRLLAIGLQRHADGHRVRIPGRELATAARRGRTRWRRCRLPRRARERRYAGIEFTCADRRCRRRQRRQDEVARLAYRPGSSAQAGRHRARQRRGYGRSDEPAGVDARGARPAAGRSAERSPEARCHDRSEQFVHLPVDRTDIVVTGCRGQRRGTGADRRHRPQLQHCTERTRGMLFAISSLASTPSSERFINSATTSSPPSTN